MDNKDYGDYCRHMNEEFVDNIVNEHLESIESGEMKKLECENITLHFFVTERKIITTIEFEEITEAIELE